MKQENIIKYTVITGLAMVAVAMFRLLPHPFNFTPVAAIALYGGAYGKNRVFSFVLPLVAMICSDILLMTFIHPEFGGALSYLTSKDALGVYISFLLIVGLGILIQKNVKTSTVVGASIGGSFLFYLITNFTTWVGAPFYPQTFAGLMECYAAGIPFYKNDYGSLFGSFFANQFIGDLFFNGILFGSHAVVFRFAGSTAHA